MSKLPLPHLVGFVLLGLLGPQARAGDNAMEVLPPQFELHGLHDGRQLLVSTTGKNSADVTRKAAYRCEPAGIVRVSEQGFVRPLAKGTATITIELHGDKRQVRVEVKDFDEHKPLHFVNDIVPLLSLHGCNAGGCHGKASGQNGFKLSLFGFDPAFDYNAIVKEARGRRMFPASPDSSLLLAKPAGRMPHGGGRRLDPDSEDYRTLRRWMAQGTPLGDGNAPTLQKLTVSPDFRVMDRKAQQQIAVLAHYTDGPVRDVTRQAQYQSNEDGRGRGRRRRAGADLRPGRRGGHHGPLHGPGRRVPRPGAAWPAVAELSRFRAGQLHRRAGHGPLEKARPGAVAAGAPTANSCAG